MQIETEIFSVGTDEAIQRLMCSRYTARCLDLINKKNNNGEVTYKKDLLPICNPAALNDLLSDLVDQGLVVMTRVTEPQTKFILELTDKGKNIVELYGCIRKALEE